MATEEDGEGRNLVYLYYKNGEEETGREKPWAGV